MKNSLPILLVEDDIVDQMNVKRAIKHFDAKNPLIIKQNGVEALEYLNDHENLRPSIIILDINMPKMNGIEFLRHIKDDQIHRMIPVIVMTTSSEEKDRLDSFSNNVSGYMVKPILYEDFLDILSTIYRYWMLSEEAPSKLMNKK